MFLLLYRSKSGQREKRKSDMMKSMNSTDASLNDSQPLEKKSKMNPMQGTFFILSYYI